MKSGLQHVFREGNTIQPIIAKKWQNVDLSDGPKAFVLWMEGDCIRVKSLASPAKKQGFKCLGLS